jgi:tetratricopeptide (TPR) repeat protein
MRTIVAFLFALPLLAQPDIEEFEKQVAQNPNDTRARLQLLFRYNRPDLPPESRAARSANILWLFEHQPTTPNLPQSEYSLDPAKDPEAYARAAAFWKKIASEPNGKARAKANAVGFFSIADRTTAIELLSTLSNGPEVSQARGKIDVFTILGVTSYNAFGQINSRAELRKSDEAVRARDILDGLADPDRLGAAGETLLQHYASIRPSFPLFGAPGPDPFAEQEGFLAMAERWFTKARELAPQNAAWGVGLARVYERRSSLNNPSQAEQVNLLRKADELFTTDQQRAFTLQRLAVAEFEIGDDAAAERDARRLLKMTPREAHFGHTVLGRLALAHKDVERAKSELLASVVSDPRTINLQPNLTLAQDLLDAGERDVVLEFLEKVRPLWKYNNGRLDHLVRVARQRNPDLLAPWNPEGYRLVRAKAPAVKLHDTEGAEWSAESAEGKPTLLYFHSDPCPSCVDPGKTVDKLAKEFAGRGVSVRQVDSRKESSAATRFMVEANPTVVAIDGHGQVAAYVIGDAPEQQYRQAFQAALTGPQQPNLLGMPGIPTMRAPSSPVNGKVSLEWERVEGAESYVVEWDVKDAQGWESDRGDGYVRVIATRETSTVLELPQQPVRWRVFAVNSQFNPQPKKSEWREVK